MPRRRDHDRAHAPCAAGQRQLRVGEELRHLLAELLRPGELRDPALREATAFVMPLGGANAEEIMAGLRRSAPFLKNRLARMIELRHMPNIAFAFDDAFESAARISALLSSPAVERDLHQPEDDDENG